MYQIAVHNNNMEIVDYISNDIPGALHFYDDKLEIYCYEASSTFEFTIDKYRDGVIQDRIRHLRDDAYISMRYDDDDYLFTIRRLVEDEWTISVYCETLNLELLNEHVGDYKNETPMTFEDAINTMGFMTLARLELGRNEIPDTMRILEYSGETTMLARILEVVKDYGAEVKFVPSMKPNGELDKITLDLYKRRTKENPDAGIGQDRKDVRLYFGRDVEGVKRTIDKTELFNALRIKDGEGNYYKFKQPFSRLNEDGKREIFVERNSSTIYAPLSMRRYPSVVKKNNCDNWTLREKTIEVIADEEDLWNDLSEIMEEHMYPKISYDISLVNHSVLSRYKIKIGDTIYINDEHFLDYLIIQARVVKLTISLTNPFQNFIELANFVTIQSQISSNLMARMAALAKEARPYTLNVRTDNGVSFKEYKGRSTITPELLHGTDVITEGVNYIYYVDGVFVSSGREFTVSPQIMNNDKIVVVVEAIYNNNMVANVEMTFFNVNDGKSPILMHIDSSSGNIFKNNIIRTTLTARLWRGEEEIDIDGSAFEYIWTKTLDDGTPDEGWNARHRTSQKTLTVTNADVFRRSMFQCDVTPIY